MPIRCARAEDLAAALALIESAGLPGEGVAEGFTEYLVAADDGRVVGVGGLEHHGDAALLRSLAVDPAHRGKGIGGRLRDRLIARAREAEARELWLLTLDARRWFERAGFGPVPRDRAPPAIRRCDQFAILCPDSAVLMRLRL